MTARMWAKNKKQSGFTIVELLIVIVVIGILAAISIVAYNGIQNRANDTTVQAEMRNLAMKVRELEAINGALPTAASTSGITGLTRFPIARGSYSTAVHNVYYCVGTGTTSGNPEFAVGAMSRSGKKFAYSSMAGAFEYTGVWSSNTNICPGLGLNTGYTFGYGYDVSSSAWFTWTQ
ncbi:MAG: Prepilin-type cleavage/methylation protein [Candidatus Saccharibacteria bacterium]|nr:Prepilin-type cleavage/methylation protein [Candidatus Saccharibacteria bacterium]